MISDIAALLAPTWGPLRLLTSSFLLAAIGTLVSALGAMILIPTLWKYLPTDRGRAHAVDSAASVGKPIAAGIIMISIFVVAAFLFVPFDFRIYASMLLILAASILGYIDDKSGGLSELTLGLCDLILAVLAAIIIFGFHSAEVWLPFTAEILVVPAWIHIPVAVGIIWFSINALNCSDGVDGLSGTLALISMLAVPFFAAAFAVKDRVAANISQYGNTSAATIPVALTEASEAGRVRPGDRLLMTAFGAGLTWGAAVMTWVGRLREPLSTDVELPPCEQTGLAIVAKTAKVQRLIRV